MIVENVQFDSRLVRKMFSRECSGCEHYCVIDNAPRKSEFYCRFLKGFRPINIIKVCPKLEAENAKRLSRKRK